MIFLLASALSASLRADDGHQWTLRDSGTQQALNGLTGNGALFVAVGNAGTILTSPDAVTWSPQVSPSKQDLNGVAWFHGLFVAVGNHSLVMTSPDGKSWTPENLIITANLRSIAASAATLVAVGDGGTILLSTDGEKWSVPAVPRSLPTRSGRAMVATPRRNFFRIVSTPHGFIIPTRDEIMTSTQGLDWASTTIIPGSDPFASGPLPQGGAKTTNAPAPNASAATTPSRRGGPGVRGRNGGWGRLGAVSDLLNSVAQSDDLIVGVGDAGQIRTFPKGGSWSLLINPLGSDFTEKLNDVYWSGRHFIAVGGNGTILSSIDGAQWEKINSSTKETLVAVSGQPGLLVAVGANGTIMTNDDLPVVAQPKITPAGGLFTSRPEVTLNCPTPGVTMHYTLDNTEPTEGSNTYDKPFLLPKPGTLRVRAFKDGMDASLESSVLFQMPLLAKIIDSTGEVRVPYSSPNPVAYFVVKTSGALPAPAFQWQRKPAGGDKWINYDGLTDKGGAKTTILGYSLDLHQWVQTVLSSPKADAETSVLEVRYDPAMDRDHFRCIISSVAGEVVSPEAELAMFHCAGSLDQGAGGGFRRGGQAGDFYRRDQCGRSAAGFSMDHGTRGESDGGAID